MTVYHCSACREPGHTRPRCPKPRYPGKYYFHGRWRDIDAPRIDRRYHGLDEYILRHLGRIPTHTRELYSRVVNDYGTVGKRSFLRRLKALRDAQQLAATELPFREGFLYARW